MKKKYTTIRRCKIFYLDNERDAMLKFADKNGYRIKTSGPRMDLGFNIRSNIYNSIRCMAILEKEIKS